jgi:hypothetical protein
MDLEGHNQQRMAAKEGRTLSLLATAVITSF